MKNSYLKKIVTASLSEDLGAGDITTNSLIAPHTQAQAKLVFKSDGIVCGLNVAESVFKTLNKKVIFKRLVEEGAKVKKGTVIAQIKGPARAILTGERVALNFLSHLSSIATQTRVFVDAVKPYASKIYDTRKTTPLLREMDRYAVRIGGGCNHRFDLYSATMIKDNHRLLWGKDLKEAVETIKRRAQKAVILEVDTLTELQQALASKADIILLDNMTPAQVRQAIRLRNKLKSNILLEASGGINLRNVRSYAKTGVERISIGALTSIIQGMDISLDFIS